MFLTLNFASTQDFLKEIIIVIILILEHFPKIPSGPSWQLCYYKHDLIIAFA